MNYITRNTLLILIIGKPHNTVVKMNHLSTSATMVRWRKNKLNNLIQNMKSVTIRNRNN